MQEPQQPSLPIEDAIDILSQRPVVLDLVPPMAEKQKPPKRSGGRESRRDREKKRGRGKRRRGRGW
jgi:hypothetical protein